MAAGEGFVNKEAKKTMAETVTDTVVFQPRRNIQRSQSGATGRLCSQLGID